MFSAALFRFGIADDFHCGNSFVGILLGKTVASFFMKMGNARKSVRQIPGIFFYIHLILIALSKEIFFDFVFKHFLFRIFVIIRGTRK